MTHYSQVVIECRDCGHTLTVEFQPAMTPNQYAKYTDGESIGYATVHCEIVECPLEDASIEAAAYPTMTESEFEMWRRWVKEHRERVAS
jgi:DNA replicative helicase MCM subunit Mcm2 (Cdc46/Mcm family)